MRAFLVVLLAAMLIPATAGAWGRKHYKDADVVARAELIVVGRIKPDSLKEIKHAENEVNSYEHRGVLIITETLKGHAADKEIPIIIHYGLKPEMGSKSLHMQQLHYPKDWIVIFDDGDTGIRVSEDILKDHIWLLRIQQHWLNTQGNDALGIYDPEDVQLLPKKKPLQAFLPKAQPSL